jgi:hypothetical protein
LLIRLPFADHPAVKCRHRPRKPPSSRVDILPQVCRVVYISSGMVTASYTVSTFMCIGSRLTADVRKRGLIGIRFLLQSKSEECASRRTNRRGSRETVPPPRRRKRSTTPPMPSVFPLGTKSDRARSVRDKRSHNDQTQKFLLTFHARFKHPVRTPAVLCD